MRFFLLCVIFVFASCTTDEKKTDTGTTNDAASIEKEIAGFYKSLKKAYNGSPISTDSLIDSFFDSDVYYVTYWGTTEPIDSTKARMRHAVQGIKDYHNKIESVNVKVYDDGAYAFFVLRQTYTLNGVLMDEYLPTTFILERRENRWVVVHSQRSADLQTIQQLMNVAQQRESPITQGK